MQRPTSFQGEAVAHHSGRCSHPGDVFIVRWIGGHVKTSSEHCVDQDVEDLHNVKGLVLSIIPWGLGGDCKGGTDRKVSAI